MEETYEQLPTWRKRLGLSGRDETLSTLLPSEGKKTRFDGNNEIEEEEESTGSSSDSSLPSLKRATEKAKELLGSSRSSPKRIDTSRRKEESGGNKKSTLPRKHSQQAQTNKTSSNSRPGSENRRSVSCLDVLKLHSRPIEIAPKRIRSWRMLPEMAKANIEFLALEAFKLALEKNAVLGSVDPEVEEELTELKIQIDQFLQSSTMPEIRRKIIANHSHLLERVDSLKELLFLGSQQNKTLRQEYAKQLNLFHKTEESLTEMQNELDSVQATFESSEYQEQLHILLKEKPKNILSIDNSGIKEAMKGPDAKIPGAEESYALQNSIIDSLCSVFVNGEMTPIVNMSETLDENVNSESSAAVLDALKRFVQLSS